MPIENIQKLLEFETIADALAVARQTPSLLTDSECMVGGVLHELIYVSHEHGWLCVPKNS